MRNKIICIVLLTISSGSALIAQNVGINTTTPLTRLHVFNGASGVTPYSQFSPLAIESNGHTYINLLSPAANETAILFGSGTSTNGVLMYNTASTPNGFQFRNNGNLTRMVINSAGNVGIGTTLPNAQLSLSATGTELAGTTASNTFRTNAGNLNTTAGSELGLASIGLLAGNNVSLGIRAYRNIAGSDWTGTALLLEYDVDNTVRAGSGFLALGANGNIGIGTLSPSEKLAVSGNIKAVNFFYTTPKTLHYTLSGVDFIPEKSTDTTSIGNGDIYMYTDVPGKSIIAPLHLPDGATIVNMKVYIIDNSITKNLQVTLLRKPFTILEVAENMGILASSGWSGLALYQTSIFSNVVDNTVYTYYISVDSQPYNSIFPSDCSLRSVIIEYTLNSTQ